MRPRVYADTSVLGDIIDPDFASGSIWVFEGATRGSLILLLSDLLGAEVYGAPQSVRRLLDGLPASAVESVPLDARAGELTAAYLAAKVVGRKRGLDTTHVAIATVARADVLLSWDRRRAVSFSARAAAGCPPHPAFGHLLPGGEGGNQPSPAGRRCRAAADEGGLTRE